jgi:hypothetical protein
MICEGDCNDSLSTMNPDETEICDGHDNDCNDLVDDVEAVDPDVSGADTWYEDSDDDNHGTGEGILSCDPLSGHTQDSDDDCDDSDASIYPDADELCDGKDNNCDEIPDEESLEFDLDGDGFLSEELCASLEGPLDCDDTDNAVYPGATELPDDIDQDCDADTGYSSPTPRWSDEDLPVSDRVTAACTMVSSHGSEHARFRPGALAGLVVAAWGISRRRRARYSSPSPHSSQEVRRQTA